MLQQTACIEKKCSRCSIEHQINIFPTKKAAINFLKFKFSKALPQQERGGMWESHLDFVNRFYSEISPMRCLPVFPDVAWNKFGINNKCNIQKIHTMHDAKMQIANDYEWMNSYKKYRNLQNKKYCFLW